MQIYIIMKLVMSPVYFVLETHVFKTNSLVVKNGKREEKK